MADFFHEDIFSEEYLEIQRLGDPVYDSPLKFFPEDEHDSGFVDDNEKVLVYTEVSKNIEFLEKGQNIPSLEKAGPRKKLYFEPGNTTSAIVTCGGLSPGLNAVIRGLVMINWYRYNNRQIYGIQYGYEGFIDDYGHKVISLTPEMVDNINKSGGTILGSSRGNQDSVRIVDRLQELGVDILYTIGGDGTQRGALDIIKEIEKREMKIAVIGLPKTIDNDINYIDKSFGMETAFSMATEAIYSAHTEARSYTNGVGLVKLMGRESGFIAAYSTLATNEVNFCLIPELDFDLYGENSFLYHLGERLKRRGHALIVVAEGTGQNFFQGTMDKDPSGNKKLNDIGLFLEEKINQYLDSIGLQHTVKYINPSYTIRSCSPIPTDAIFCTQLAQMAVHAGMSGRTGMVTGYLNGQFTHIPTRLATERRKKINLRSQLWASIMEATGQPLNMKNKDSE